jgi:hypothetical protein
MNDRVWSILDSMARYDPWLSNQIAYMVPSNTSDVLRAYSPFRMDIFEKTLKEFTYLRNDTIALDYVNSLLTKTRRVMDAR